jgi:hypothetical protein
LNIFDKNNGRENFRRANKGSELDEQDLSDSDYDDEMGIGNR